MFRLHQFQAADPLEILLLRELPPPLLKIGPHIIHDPRKLAVQQLGIAGGLFITNRQGTGIVHPPQIPVVMLIDVPIANLHLSVLLGDGPAFHKTVNHPEQTLIHRFKMLAEI